MANIGIEVYANTKPAEAQVDALFKKIEAGPKQTKVAADPQIKLMQKQASDSQKLATQQAADQQRLATQTATTQNRLAAQSAADQQRLNQRVLLDKQKQASIEQQLAAKKADFEIREAARSSREQIKETNRITREKEKAIQRENDLRARQTKTPAAGKTGLGQFATTEISGAVAELAGIPGIAGRAVASLGGLTGVVIGTATAFGTLVVSMASLDKQADRSRAALQNFGLSGKDAAAVYEQLKNVAGDTGGNIQDLTKLYARLNAAQANTGLSQQGLLDATKGLSAGLKAFGADTTQAQSFLLQFSQTIGSGKVQGDEFNAMVESAGPLLDFIAKRLQGPTANARTLQKALKDGTITLQQFTGEFAKAGPELSKMAQSQFTLLDSTNKLLTAIGGFADALNLGSIADAAVAAIDYITRSVNGLTMALKEFQLRANFDSIQLQETRAKEALDNIKVLNKEIAQANIPRNVPGAQTLDDNAIRSKKEQVAELTRQYQEATLALQGLRKDSAKLEPAAQLSTKKPDAVVPIKDDKTAAATEKLILERAKALQLSKDELAILQAQNEQERISAESVLRTNQIRAESAAKQQEIMASNAVATEKQNAILLTKQEEMNLLAAQEIDLNEKLLDSLIAEDALRTKMIKDRQDERERSKTAILEAPEAAQRGAATDKSRKQFEKLNEETKKFNDTVHGEILTGAQQVADTIAQWAVGMNQNVSIGRQLLAIMVQVVGQIAIAAATRAFAGGLASGGTASAGSMYRVGEQGPEMFSAKGKNYMIPGETGTVTPNNRLKPAAGGGRKVVVNNYAGAEVQVTRNDDEIIEVAVTRAVSAARRDFAQSVGSGYGEYAQSMNRSFDVRRKV